MSRSSIAMPPVKNDAKRAVGIGSRNSHCPDFRPTAPTDPRPKVLAAGTRRDWRSAITVSSPGGGAGPDRARAGPGGDGDPARCVGIGWGGLLLIFELQWSGRSSYSWEGELADELVILLLRSAGAHNAAAEQLRTVFGQQVAGYVRQVTHDAPDSTRRAGLIATQVLGLALCRYVLGLAPVAEMPAEELAAAIGPTLQRYLFGDLGGA